MGLFQSRTKSNIDGLENLRVEAKNMLEQVKNGNFKARFNAHNLHPDIAGPVKDFNEMLDLIQNATDYIITRFELVNKITNVGLWDMNVIDGDPVNPNNTFTWTDEFRHMLGYLDEHDFPNVLSSWSEKLHPEDHDWVLEAFANHLIDRTGRTPYDVQYRLKMKTGEYYWFRALGSTIRDEHGVPLRVIGSLFNIHDSKLKEEQTQAILTRFNLVNKAAKIGLWDMEVVKGDPVNPNNTFTWTDEFRHMLGFSDQHDFPNVLSSWSDKLHPEDYDWVIKAFADHLTDHSGRTPYSVDYRLKLKEGSYEWFHAEGETIRDHEGVPLRVAGSIRNITNEKMKERIEAEIAKKIEDFSYTIKQLVESIESITVSAQELALDQENTMRAAQQMKAGTVETIKINDFIKNLSKQTNLLGLNASIEAARSGKEGHGFQVVASEIRNLSKSSVSAADQISNSIEAMNGSINEIFHSVEKVSSVTQTQVSSTEEVNALVEEIYALTEELFSLTKKMI